MNIEVRSGRPKLKWKDKVRISNYYFYFYLLTSNLYFELRYSVFVIRYSFQPSTSYFDFVIRYSLFVIQLYFSNF